MAVITSPNLDHASLLLFEKNFERLASNKDTQLLNCPAIKHMDIKGISNISRIEGNDLVDVTSSGRNPQKQYLQIRNDNRKSVAKRFTGTYLVDSYDRAVKLITDPTSDLFQNLREAKNRLTDKCIIDAAVGSVIVGAPDAAGTTLTAAQDGVKTIAGTTAFTYANVISPAITTFKNQYVDTQGVTLAISATEEEALRDDDKYMNALYSHNNTVDRGTITNASGFNVVTFAGNKQGEGSTVDLPILPEAEGVRSNVLMAPKSIAFAVEVGRLDCDRSATHVNSWEVTIDMWVKAVRLQGSKVIILTSTM
jgi:hypothetical protein